MINKNLEAIEHRFKFYRDGWRAMIVILTILIVCLVALTITVAYALSREPEPRYFAVENGRMIPMVPVSTPYIKPGDLNQWVARAIMESYMIDFQNFRARISENAKYFTPEGFDDYKRSLEESGRMKTIIDGWFVGSAVPEGPPVIVQEGVVNGRYMWRVRMPIIVSYNSKTHSLPPQRLMLTVVVVRVSSWENPYGIGISQIVERSNTVTN